MGQILLSVCNRCGADRDDNNFWQHSSEGKWLHTCPDGYFGAAIDVEEAAKRPNLYEDGVEFVNKEVIGSDADVENARIFMAMGLLKGWSDRGIMVIMQENEDIQPKFSCIVPEYDEKLDMLSNPPTQADAQLLIEFEGPIRSVLAVRGELCRAGNAEASGEEHSGGDASLLEREGGMDRQGRRLNRVKAGASERSQSLSGPPSQTANRRGAGLEKPAALSPQANHSAGPRYDRLNFAGFQECLSDPKTKPPFTCCPSCGGEEVVFFWEQPVLLSGSFPIQIIYHCMSCERDDLYGTPIGQGHRSLSWHPHIGTQFPSGTWSLRDLPHPSKIIELKPIKIEAEEHELSAPEEPDPVYVNHLKEEEE